MNANARILGVLLSAAAGTLSVTPVGIGAQNLSDVVAQCSGGLQPLQEYCQEAALAVQSAQGALGLAASGGTDLPGSASTMGWRTKGSPRIALGFRGTLVRAPLFDVSLDPWPKRGSSTATVPALYVSGTLGLFDGFSLGPTVGGFASVDLMASGHWVSAPRDMGLQGTSTGWGVGGRLGILRESFSLPGITLSAFHRSLGTSTAWSWLEDVAEGEFELRALSIRGVVGKDLWGVGLVAGAGWDRYTGDVLVQVQDVLGGSTGRLTGELRSDRRLYFLGGSMTFLVLQISGEVGFARGFDPGLAVPRSGGTDPSSSSHFGSLAFRLTF